MGEEEGKDGKLAFGQRLQLFHIGPWRGHYLRYDTFKSLIKTLAEHLERCECPVPNTPLTLPSMYPCCCPLTPPCTDLHGWMYWACHYPFWGRGGGGCV